MSESSLKWERLSWSGFEDVCRELLIELGFRNVDWRRGTALSGTTGDGGRDIEAIRVVTDPDGFETKERWFVQAKHRSSVPPEELEAAFAWAVAERPDVLLIATTGFLSNACKQWIETYKSKNQPSFRIRYWERPDLERLLSNNRAIVGRHHLSSLETADIWEDALRDWQDDLLLASPDRLQMFFEGIDDINPDFESIYFLLRSELETGAHPMQRDWLSLFSEGDLLACLAVACVSCLSEALSPTKRAWASRNPTVATLVEHLLTRQPVRSIERVLWDPYSFTSDTRATQIKKNKVYRRFVLGSMRGPLVEQTLDQCSEGCMKMHWPPPSERRSQFLVIQSKTQQCKLGVILAQSQSCPVFQMDDLFSKPPKRAELRMLLNVVQSVAIREVAWREREREFEELTIDVGDIAKRFQVPLTLPESG